MFKYSALVPLLIALDGCSVASDCNDTLRLSKTAPNGQHIAYLYVRDCGATTQYATRLAIGDREGSLSRAKTVFIADENHGKALKEGPAIWTQMRWNSASELFFAYAENARVFRRQDKVDGVTVRYLATRPMILPAAD